MIKNAQIGSRVRQTVTKRDREEGCNMFMETGRTYGGVWSKEPDQREIPVGQHQQSSSPRRQTIPAELPESGTAKELEAFLRIDEKAICGYVRRGLIPYVRIQLNLRARVQEVSDCASPRFAARSGEWPPQESAVAARVIMRIDATAPTIVSAGTPRGATPDCASLRCLLRLRGDAIREQPGQTQPVSVPAHKHRD